MDCRGADAPRFMASIERDGEEYVCGLRTTVRDEGLVGSAFEIRIFEVDVRIPVSGGRQIDNASTWTNEKSNPVDQNKVAEVIGAELHFKAIDGFGKRCCHDASVGDDDVERLAFCDKFVCRGANAFEAGKIEFDQFEAAATGSGIFFHLSGCGFGFRQIARGADDVCAVCDEGTRGFNTDSGRNACDEKAFALQINARQDFFRRGSRSKCMDYLTHTFSFVLSVRFELRACG